MPSLGMKVSDNCNRYEIKRVNNAIKKDKLYTSSKDDEDISEHYCTEKEDTESIKLMTMSMDIPSEDRTTTYPMIFSVYSNLDNEIICTQIKYSGNCKKYCVDSEMIKNKKQNLSK
jgi:hypothetical protein